MADSFPDTQSGPAWLSGENQPPETLSMYAQVLDSMVEGVSLSDEQGIICYTNPAEDGMFGYRRGELVGKHVSVQGTYTPDEYRLIAEEIGEQIRTRGHWSGELSNRKQDGTPFTTAVRITGIEVAGKRYWVRVQEDTTERKKAENALAVRVRQQAVVAALGQRALAGVALNTLMDETASLVAETLDVEYCKILELLPGGDRLLLRAGAGWREGLVGKITVGMGPDSQAGFTLASDSPIIVEDLRTDPRFNGPLLLRQHGVISGVSVIILGGSRPFGVIGAHTSQRRTFTRDDVNFLQSVANVLASAIARARVEEELHRSRDQLEVILQGVADAITVQDATGKLIYANEAAARLLGFASQQELVSTPPSELTGKFEVLDEKGRPLPLSELPGRHVLEGRDVATRTVGWRIRDTGELRWSMVKAAPVRNERGEVHLAVNIVRDITDRIELERRKDDFIALASHELKTPITSLKIFAQMLKRRFERVTRSETDNHTRELAQDAVVQLTRMDEQLSKLTELVRDLLDVSKINAGKLAYSMEQVDVDDIVRETVEDLQRIADKHRIVLEGQSGRTVTADRERIRQVLTNLVTNAIKYSPDAAEIIVRVSDTNGKGIKNGANGKNPRKRQSALRRGEVIISVQDYGIGIPKHSLDRIFDRFFQVVDSGTTHQDTYPGLGLGLYISSEIVKRHGGRIWVESEGGKGSTFYFTLPVSAQRATRSAQQPAQPANEIAGSAG